MSGRPDVRIVAERPTPGTPRPYDFPAVARSRLANGLRSSSRDLPGRPLVAATLVLRNGAADEPDDEGGATVLAARALTEGTERYDAIALVEAGERLGASLHAEAGWDAMSVGVDVPAERLEPALELLAEVALRPTFPDAEVDRLRDERLNDLLQAEADPRRRADEAFAATIYAPGSPVPPSGGRAEAHGRRARRGAAPGRLPARPRSRTGDARRRRRPRPGSTSPRVAERLLGGWGAASAPADRLDRRRERRHAERFVRVIHRPGSVQTEIRIGHRRSAPADPRTSTPCRVMGAILGGLFNSRLNTKLREEKGYTYGASAGFDLRRAAGPFAARAAVNTEVTVPAIVDSLAELDADPRRRRSRPPSSRRPATFSSASSRSGSRPPAPSSAPLAGLAVHELPDDELARYRPAIEAVTIESVQAAATAHLRPHAAAIVLVGDVDAFGGDLEAAGLGRIVIERETGARDEGRDRDPIADLEALDSGPEGPTEGAEETAPPVEAGPDPA